MENNCGIALYGKLHTNRAKFTFIVNSIVLFYERLFFVAYTYDEE